MPAKRPQSPRPAPKPRKTGQGKGTTPKPRPKASSAKRAAPLTWADARVEATTTGGWRFTIPVVTSANRLWRSAKGRTYKAKTAFADTSAAAVLFWNVVPLEGDLSVAITWHRSQKSGDVDNRIKGTLDLLRGIAYRDDASVARVSCTRVDDGTAARLVVDVDNLPRAAA